MLICIRIGHLQVLHFQIFFNMKRRLSPVAGTPNDIGSCTKQVIRQYFIEFVGRFVVQNRLYSCRSISRSRVGDIGLDSILFE